MSTPDADELTGSDFFVVGPGKLYGIWCHTTDTWFGERQHYTNPRLIVGDPRFYRTLAGARARCSSLRRGRPDRVYEIRELTLVHTDTPPLKKPPKPRKGKK